MIVTDRENFSDENADVPPPADRAPPPARRQFGLRKLMLWTVMVALWCGTFAGSVDKTNWVVCTAWVTAVVLTRIPFGRRGSVRAGGVPLAMLVAVGFCVDRLPELARRGTLGEWGFEGFLALWLVAVSFLIGMLFTRWIDAVIDMVDSLDRRLAGKRK